MPNLDPQPTARWRRQRWDACGLSPPPGPGSAETVAAEVGRLGCVQAQDFDMTLWSLSRRTGAPRGDVLETLATGQVVRTHAMRTTWHLVRRDDLALVQAATADRVHALLRPMLRGQGVQDRTLAQWAHWLGDLLQAGPMTRQEVRTALQGSPFDFDGMTLGFALMWAELSMLVASGPPRGQVHTYQWMGEDRQLPDRHEAIRWLVGTFLSSHGPSTIADVCAWSSLTVTAVRRAIRDLGDAVSHSRLLGADRYWIGPLSEGMWPERPTVSLVNGYDEYISGLDARSKELLDPDGLRRPRPGVPIAVVMVDGMFAGHWRRRAASSAVSVQIHALRPLSGAELAELEESATSYAAFVGLPVDVLHVDRQ